MGVVAYTCNPNTQEAKTGGSRFAVPSHPDTKVKIRMLNCFRDSELLRIQGHAPTSGSIEIWHIMNCLDAYHPVTEFGCFPVGCFQEEHC